MLSRHPLLTLSLAVVVLVVVVTIGAGLGHRDPAMVEPEAVEHIDVAHPTGAAYDPARDHVYILGGGGEIGEYDQSLHRHNRFRLLSRFSTMRSLTGITADTDPRTNFVYVLDGDNARIHEVDLGRNPPEVRRTFALDLRDVPPLRETSGGPAGLSGLCFLPPQGSGTGGRFMLTHRDDPSGLVEVELPLGEPAPDDPTMAVRAQFVNWYPLSTEHLAEVTYDEKTRTLLVLSDDPDALTSVELNGTRFRYQKLPPVSTDARALALAPGASRPVPTGLALLRTRQLLVTLDAGAVLALPPVQWGDPLPASAREPIAEPTTPPAKPTPYYEMDTTLVRDDLFPRWNTRSDWRRYIPNGWILFGFGGQFLFMMRFVVQWWVSEKRKRVTVPVVFWYISIMGTLTILVYAIHRRDVVFIAGQALACTIYVRNLTLIYGRRGPRRASDVGLLADSGSPGAPNGDDAPASAAPEAVQMTTR